MTRVGVGVRLRILVLTLLVEGGLLLLAYLLGWLVAAPPFARRATDSGGALLIGLLATAPMLGLFALSMGSRWSPLVRIRQLLLDDFMPLLSESGAPDLLLISLLAGIGEEALFRGVIQVALADWLGVGLGLAITSLLFGLAHAVTFGYLVLATCMGAYLGWLLQYSGGMIAPVVTHALYDFVALLYLRRRFTARASASEAGAPPR